MILLIQEETGELFKDESNRRSTISWEKRNSN